MARACLLPALVSPPPISTETKERKREREREREREARSNFSLTFDNCTQLGPFMIAFTPHLLSEVRRFSLSPPLPKIIVMLSYLHLSPAAEELDNSLARRSGFVLVRAALFMYMRAVLFAYRGDERLESSYWAYQVLYGMRNFCIYFGFRAG